MKKNLYLLIALLLVPTLICVPTPALEQANITNQQELSYGEASHTQLNQHKDASDLLDTSTKLLKAFTKQQRSGFSKFCYWTVQTIVALGIVVLLLFNSAIIQKDDNSVYRPSNIQRKPKPVYNTEESDQED